MEKSSNELKICKNCKNWCVDSTRSYCPLNEEKETEGNHTCDAISNWGEIYFRLDTETQNAPDKIQ